MKNPLLLPLLLVLYEIVVYLSNDMYLPALPDMMKDLSLTPQLAQLTLTYWFIGSAAMPLFVGALTDRFGRRKILLIGGGIYILAGIFCALTNNLILFLLGRAIEGAMVAFMLVPGYACIHESYAKQDAIKILAFMGSIVVLAPALGPLLGSILLIALPWRAIFWFIVIWSCINIALLYLWMPESLPAEHRKTLHPKTLLQSYWKILCNIRFMGNMLVLGFMFGGFIAWISAGPLLVMENFHFSKITFGVLQAIIFTAYIIASRLVKWLLNYLGAEKLIQLGLSMTFGSGLLMLIFSIIFPTSLLMFIITMTLYSLSSALCFSPLNRTIIESSHEAMGVRVAAFTVSLMTFAALGSATAGFLFNGHLISLAIIIATAISIASAIKLYLLRTMSGASVYQL